MAQLGDMLRDAREERGISLAQAERETKIRQKYISALEDDNSAALPGAVYARGFLRNYALYLGINPDEAQDMFDNQSQPTRTRIRAARGETAIVPRVRQKSDKISIQPLSPQPIDTRVRYGSSYIAVSLLALPLIIAFYFIYSAYAGRTNANAPILTPQSRPATVTTLPTSASIVTLVGTPSGAFNTPTVLVPQAPGAPQPTQPGTSSSPQPSVTAPLATSVIAQVSVTRDSYLRITADGRQVYVGTLAKGSTRQYTGKSTVRILTGRGDSTRVTINGVDQGFMGTAANQVVTKEWDRLGNATVIK
ncbi:MAG: DUF4115 domain-containing protein [Chloroflexota bacterium]|nr:DUF4115 domain-containing protein [Chloroflexota bacterium]